jgi:hypothetical protein
MNSEMMILKENSEKEKLSLKKLFLGIPKLKLY